MSRPPPLSADLVRLAIDRALSGGVIEVWDHCRLRLRERGADVLDLRHCLAHGAVQPGAQWNSRYGHWRYRIAGVDFEGDSMTAVTVVVRDGYIQVVTMFE